MQGSCRHFALVGTVDILPDMHYLRKLKIELVKGEFKNPIKGQVKEPSQVFSVFRDIKDWAKETAIGVYLNDNLEMNSYEIHSVGGSDISLVLPDELFRSAILTNSKYFILIHNHPSGRAVPSEEDWKVIRMLKQQSYVMRKYFLDFIIVGDNQYWSSFEEGESGEYPKVKD